MKMMTKNQKGEQTGFLLKLSKQSNIYVISEFSYSVEKKKSQNGHTYYQLQNLNTP